MNILSVGTGIEEHAAYGIDFIRAVAWIKEHLPLAKTSGGVSNLSFAFRGNNAVREAMHSAFLYHAVRAGLDMGIVNPSMLQIYDDIEPNLLRAVEDVILNRTPEATETLIALADQLKLMKEEGATTSDTRNGRLAKGQHRGTTAIRTEQGRRQLSSGRHHGGAACLRQQPGGGD